MKFPALFDPAPEGGFTVTFRDMPEAITKGDTMEEAEAMALDELVTAMESYFENGRQVPVPSEAKEGERLVALPLSIAAKVHLLNVRLTSRMKSADIARIMGIKPQELARIFDLKHATKIDTLAAAFKALGEELVVAPLDYLVIPKTDRISLEELRLARNLFQALVEAKLGGSARAKHAFKLRMRQHDTPLSEEELNAVEQWVEAERASRELANQAIDAKPGKVSFLVRENFFRS